MEVLSEHYAHDRWLHPVVGGASICFRFRTYKGALFYPGYILRVGSCEKAIWSKFRIEGDQGAFSHKQVLDCLLLIARTITPLDSIRLSQRGYISHPLFELG